MPQDVTGCQDDSQLACMEARRLTKVHGAQFRAAELKHGFHARERTVHGRALMRTRRHRPRVERESVESLYDLKVRSVGADPDLVAFSQALLLDLV